MRTLKHFITAALLLCTASTFAHDFEVDGIYYNIISDSEVEVTSGNSKYDGNIVIPTSIVYSDISYTVTSIGDNAFYACMQLISIELPNTITNIGEAAFEQCLRLAHIEIPNGIINIERAAFSNCHKLTSIEIPDSATNIGESAFFACISLTHIEIPYRVKSISKGLFGMCSSLTSIEIPNSVTNIGEIAFHHCSSLSFIEIPSSISSIGRYSFQDCTGLQHIYCQNEIPAECDSSTFYNVHRDTCVLHVPAGCVEAYQAADGWKDFVNIVGDQAGIEYVTTTDGPADYFDLQGRKVTAPSNGIFIKKQGNSTKKVLL